jgi:hypothetical protein
MCVAILCTLTPESFLIIKKKSQWPESTSELYRPSDRRLLAKLVPTSADRRCHVVSVTNPYGRILGLEPLLFLSSNSSIVLTRLSGPCIWQWRESNPNFWICSQELRPLDHDHYVNKIFCLKKAKKKSKAIPVTGLGGL